MTRSWDTHVGLGSVSNGDMLVHLTELAQGVAAFFADLGSAADKVTLVTMSEFGRRVEENGGHGNAMLLLGAGVRGGLDQLAGAAPSIGRAPSRPRSWAA